MEELRSRPDTSLWEPSCSPAQVRDVTLVRPCAFLHAQCRVACESLTSYSGCVHLVSSHCKVSGPMFTVLSCRVCPARAPQWRAAAAGVPGDTLLGYTGWRGMAWVHVFPRLALPLLFLGSGRWPVSSLSSPAPLVPGAVMMCPDSGAGSVTPISEAGQVTPGWHTPGHSLPRLPWISVLPSPVSFSSVVTQRTPGSFGHDCH